MEKQLSKSAATRLKNKNNEREVFRLQCEVANLKRELSKFIDDKGVTISHSQSYKVASTKDFNVEIKHWQRNYGGVENFWNIYVYIFESGVLFKHFDELEIPFHCGQNFLELQTFENFNAGYKNRTYKIGNDFNHLYDDETKHSTLDETFNVKSNAKEIKTYLEKCVADINEHGEIRGEQNE